MFSAGFFSSLTVFPCCQGFLSEWRFFPLSALALHSKLTVPTISIIGPSQCVVAW